MEESVRAQIEIQWSTDCLIRRGRRFADRRTTSASNPAAMAKKRDGRNMVARRSINCRGAASQWLRVRCSNAS